VFINLETDPHIPHSSPHHTCVNLPPPIAFGLPLMSALGRYSDSCSLLRSDSTRNPTLVVLSICLSEYSSTSLQSCIHVYQPHSELRIYPRYEFSELHSDIPLRRPLGHPCLNSSYKSEPAPSDPIRTSVLIHVTIRTLAIQLRSEVCLGIRSDIRVLLHLTSSSPCLRGPLGPLSLSVL
jgi:hypothetical protein